MNDRARAEEILVRLRALGSERNRQGQARFGINVARAYGVGVTQLRAIAREIKRDHSLALALWDTEVHEARILASMIADPARMSARATDGWARAFDSWDLTDQVCNNLFGKTPHAVAKVREWSEHREEFRKRAAFALMAVLAVHDKEAPDALFEEFLGICEREAGDDRPYVRKAVNWALRQIGKRNAGLRARATESAERIKAQGTRSARWIAADALRELRR